MDSRGRARMVDVGAKPPAEREALAHARVRFPVGVLPALLRGAGPKGPVQEVARLAGLMAAKRTAELIPMCHALALDHIEIEFERRGARELELRCRVRCRGATGVEMEALVGAALAALTVYDMSKALSHAIEIRSLRLLEKRGGKSGHWRAPVTRG